MATSRSCESRPIRISPPSVPQLVKSSPVKQRHCSDDDDISNPCGSHPATQNPNAFETRNGEVTTIVRYPPSDSPSSEIRYSITVVEISEDCLNDSVREERQPTPRTLSSRARHHVQKIKQFLVDRVEKQRKRLFSGNWPLVEEGDISGSLRCGNLTEATRIMETTIAEEDE